VQQLLVDYHEALERLKKGQPLVLPKGTKITNDAVSLEAGRGKGSIKKSRPIFSELIREIKQAAMIQSQPQNQLKDRFARMKNAMDDLRRELDAAYSREISLLYEVFELKKKLVQLTGEKILPLRGKTGDKQPIASQ